MEEQWINNLRQRFEDRQMSAPEGLWDSIETAMTHHADETGAAKAGKQKARTVPMWLRTAVAAAACIAVLIGIGIILTDRNDNIKALTAQKTDKSNKPSVAESNADDHVSENVGEATPQGLVARTAQRLRQILSSGDTETATTTTTERTLLAANNTASEPSTTVNDGTEPAEAKTSDSDRKDGTSVVEHRNGNYYAVQQVRKLPPTAPGKTQSHVTMSVYGVGLTSTGTNSAAGNPSNTYSDPITMPFINSGMMLMASPIARGELTQLSPEEVHVKHRQPIKVGVSARFPLNDVLSLESGLYYTYLSSDFERGDNNGGTRIEQRLHYIGLPMRLNASVWKNENLDIYVGAGGAAEIGVSGTRHTERMENTGVQRVTNESMREKRPQFSVNAAAGVQYNLNGLIGVYAEPGVSYYIDNKSGIKTYYTDKPWNFNLSLGLRFTFR